VLDLDARLLLLARVGRKEGSDLTLLFLHEGGLLPVDDREPLQTRGRNEQ